MKCNPDQTKICNIIKSEKFKKCVWKLGNEKVEEYLQSCRIDVCAYHEKRNLLESVLCDTLEAFIGECAKAGITIRWRGTDLCRKIIHFELSFLFSTFPYFTCIAFDKMKRCMKTL